MILFPPRTLPVLPRARRSAAKSAEPQAGIVRQRCFAILKPLLKLNCIFAESLPIIREKRSQNGLRAFLFCAACMGGEPTECNANISHSCAVCTLRILTLLKKYQNHKIVLFYPKILLKNKKQIVHNGGMDFRRPCAVADMQPAGQKTENCFLRMKERKSNGKNQKSAGQVL